ncbi:MAG: hypothetical protein RLZZ618_407 [Pseudomonadota bacterium]
MTSPSRFADQRGRVARKTLSARFWQAMLALLVIAVCFLALTPTPPSTVVRHWDKLNHAVAFAALTLSALLGLWPHRTGSWRVFIPMLGFGVLIEILQMLVPGRSSEWADLVADGVGMAIGAALAFAATRWVRWRQRQRAVARL